MRPAFRVLAITACALSLLAAPADAARIPTRAEDAALNRLLTKVMGDSCATALTVSRSRPLIAEGRKWGHVSVYCQFGDPPSGAGTLVLEVWARRSTPTSTDWRIVGPKYASRVHPCRGKEGLLTSVPERIVRDLRVQCNTSRGARPAPRLELSIFRNALHEFADIGPWLSLYSNSGSFSLYGDPEEPSPYPKLADLTEAFGTPQRTGCTAFWPRIDLRATACTDDRVTQLILRSPWLLEQDIEGDDRGGAMVRVGDHVTLARYLDYRLKPLRANGSLVLAQLRIGHADITATVITAHARITAIQIDLQLESGRAE